MNYKEILFWRFFLVDVQLFLMSLLSEKSFVSRNYLNTSAKFEILKDVNILAFIYIA